MTWAVVIRTDGTVERREEPYDYTWLRETIGGYVEPILLDGNSLGDSVMMMLDEDGKMKRAEPNEAASVLLAEAGGHPSDFVVGTAVIIAHEARPGSEDGPAECLLPDTWLQRIEELTR